MAWSKGQAWRVVRSLDRLNTQIRAAYPQAVPPATPAAAWGSIADSAHSTTSDHYPHFYSALGSTAVVCARDFPHAPGLGLDAHALAERLRASRDPRIGYVISNGRITGPNYGWRWASYSGSDPHDTHIHVSTVHTAAADDPRDWTIGEDDDMTPEELRDADIWPNPYGDRSTNPRIALGTAVRNIGRDTDQTLAEVRAVRAGQAAILAAVQGLDTKAVLARIDQVATAEAQRDAELPARVLAALPAGEGPVSRDDLEAALRSVLGSVDNPPAS